MVSVIHLPDAMIIYVNYAQPENVFVISTAVAKALHRARGWRATLQDRKGSRRICLTSLRIFAMSWRRTAR